VKRKKELDDIDKKKEKKKRKEDFEMKVVKPVPSDGGNKVRPFAKPGHWLTTTHEIKANNFNFSAQLQTGVTDSRGKPLHVESTHYILEASRPAKLAKGQARSFETTYFVPKEAADPEKVVWLNRELRASRGGRLVKPPDPSPITPMPSYQYYFVVLSSTPTRYGFLQRLTSINAPINVGFEEFEGETLLYYRVLQPEIDRFVPLPSNALTWTCIAYLLIDDLDQSHFTPPQERALLDWLHWGGQVIISGPSSLDKLKGSFLEDYLPAQSGDTVEIAQAAIDELNDNWSLPKHKRSGKTRTLDVLPETPMIGVELHPHEDAVPLANTAGLVLERRIGQGRIVVTSFSLTDRYMMQWGSSYDSFFNACLLRRPRREFISDNTALLLMNTTWKDFPDVVAKDSRLVTTQRYFTRDIGHHLQAQKRVIEPGEEKNVRAIDGGPLPLNFENVASARKDVIVKSGASRPEEDNWHFDGYPERLNYGLGVWNDRSGASDAARQALDDAAGISIPPSSLVLRILALYLVVLAPLNWLLFRMIGRVEWAWMAAPVIAIVGAFVVVRTAQLDIGFARSVTEVVVAEVHADYPRAHVTRYTTMYTSLSTGYDFIFDDSSALAQPFGSDEFQPDRNKTIYTVTMNREAYLRFSGMQVDSNSHGYVHSEQYADLGGVFSLTGDETEGFEVRNGSSFNLKGAGILRGMKSRGAGVDGRVQAAWVGDLKAGSFASLKFTDLPIGTKYIPQWDDALATLSYEKQAKVILKRLDTNNDKVISRAEATYDRALSEKFRSIDSMMHMPEDGLLVDAEIKEWCRQTRAGEVSVGQLLELASQRLSLREGEIRLIAYSDDEIPGVNIRPIANQILRRTLFIVHLRRAPMSKAMPDVNCKADLTNDKERKLDEEDLKDDYPLEGEEDAGGTDLDDGSKSTKKLTAAEESKAQAKEARKSTGGAVPRPTSGETPKGTPAAAVRDDIPSNNN
jgi:hypothetical protein